MNAVKSGIRGKLREDEPMARHTSWRVGGPANRWYEPADLADLQAFLAGLPRDEPIYWVGLGSNLLVRDGGIDGTVVSSHPGLAYLCRVGPLGVEAGAGLACAKLARQSARWGLSGADFFAGIPGTVGGALAMNAGAFGGETWACVDAVEVLARDGSLQWRSAGEFRVGYRWVEGLGADEWFVAARLHLDSDQAGESPRRVRSLLARRAATQPLGRPSCGSVFRNPPGNYAARLIEACGLKGYAIGGAEISTKHANFIVNNGGARAADVEALIEHVREQVAARFGIRLEPEVRIVGRAS